MQRKLCRISVEGFWLRICSLVLHVLVLYFLVQHEAIEVKSCCSRKVVCFKASVRGTNFGPSKTPPSQQKAVRPALQHLSSLLALPLIPAGFHMQGKLCRISVEGFWLRICSLVPHVLVLYFLVQHEAIEVQSCCTRKVCVKASVQGTNFGPSKMARTMSSCRTFTQHPPASRKQ